MNLSSSSSLRLDTNSISTRAAVANPFNGSQSYQIPFDGTALRKVVKFSPTCSSATKPVDVVVDKHRQKVGELGFGGLSRIESLSQVSGVLNCQWGDKGKGKLLDILAQHFDTIARCQVTYHRFFTLQSFTSLGIHLTLIQC
ncbi:unnamed protein product [Coffea canephora]|uniref:Uncharacterized protein n=1 Tax=Coffea canephora TaxID=49390 RepID=A0A068UNF6_COFCA|nr:unnamed protein product [Coffea canephora]